MRGMAIKMVGANETRATNQVCSKNSRHAQGGRNIKTKVSKHIAKKPPAAVSGFAAR